MYISESEGSPKRNLVACVFFVVAGNGEQMASHSSNSLSSEYISETAKPTQENAVGQRMDWEPRNKRCVSRTDGRVALKRSRTVQEFPAHGFRSL